MALETSNIVLPESLTLSNLKREQGRQHRRSTDLGPDGIDLEREMAHIEKDYIFKAVEMAHGSKKKAAELLGIGYEPLRRRLLKLKT